MAANLKLPYGKGTLDVTLDTDDADVFEPRHAPALDDPHAAFERAISSPEGNVAALRNLISRDAKVAIVTPDRTRCSRRKS